MLDGWYGWETNEPVIFHKEWCAICTKSRWHEKLNGWIFCLYCAEKTEIPQATPGLQIERFIKEGI